MTTPQVHLIMLGLGLLAYVLITGFRSSRKSISRQHRRRWWLGAIAGTVVALSPLSQFWRKPFNSIDLLTQSLLISAVSLLGLLLFALMLTPYKAVCRFFRKRRQDVELMLTRNDEGLSPIAINAESSNILDDSPVTALESPDPLQAIYTTNAGEKSIAETINESGEVHADIELTDIELTKPVNGLENNSKSVDQATTKKLATTDIESVVPVHGKADGTHQLDKKLSRSSAANDKLSTAQKKTDSAIEHTSSKLAHAVESKPRTEQQTDETLRLDELVDDTLQLDELADDTLRLDEMLPNGEQPANDESQDIGEQNVAYEELIDDQPPADDELQAEELLLAEDGLLAEDELDIASLPSDEESFDLSDAESLFSEVRSQHTEVELPDDKELRDANDASAIDELDLDTALLEGDKPETGTKQKINAQSVEIEEADLIDNGADFDAEEADLEFGNDLTGEYAHPADEYELTHDLSAEQLQVDEHLAEQSAASKLNTNQVSDQPAATEQTATAHKPTEEHIPDTDVLVVHHANKKVAEPKTLAAALVAAKLTADSVESQVSNLEQRIAKLDGYRNASISSANTSAEQHTVALEQTSALLTSEDEARRAAESVIAAQKAMLKRAKEQQAEVDALLKQERKHLRLLKSEVERSRKMARTAALLARKAAVAQQEIRNVAKREQTARLKSEESTRKAVNIARNAINALAEEERKRDLTQH